MKYWFRLAGASDTWINDHSRQHWRITRGAKPPRATHVWSLPAQLTDTPAFLAFYLRHVGHDIVATLREVRRKLAAMVPRRSNPAGQRARGTHARNRSAAYRKAHSLARRFTGMEPIEAGSVKLSPLPTTAFAIGRVDAIDYETQRHGEIQRFRHVFKRNARPLFCASPDGKQLLLIGGAFRFTERGIVDHRPRRR